MAKTRRANACVSLNGADISKHIIDLRYTDNCDKTDAIRVTLEDRAGSFIQNLPNIGSRISAAISVQDWHRAGDAASLNFGSFELDSINHSGNLVIGGVAVPIAYSARSQKKNRTWRKLSLSAIAQDIANSTELAMVFESSVDPLYEEVAQNNKSDLEFLVELAKADGLCIKVTMRQLIVFCEVEFDARPGSVTLTRGESHIIGDPRLSRESKDTYQSCRINYYCPQADGLVTGYFRNPDSFTGHTLVLRERHEALFGRSGNPDNRAQSRLRESNKNEWTCSFILVGDTRFVSGMNFNLRGYGAFDGKYSAATCIHTISGNGYITEVRGRRCLTY